MNTHINDSPLVAYALNELDDLARAEVEKALETDEEARKRLAELQAAAHLATEAFNEAPVHTLENSQREKILQTARQANTFPEKGRPFSKRLKHWPSLNKELLAGVALSLIVIVGVTVIVSGNVKTTMGSYQITDFYGTPTQLGKSDGDGFVNDDAQAQLKMLGYINSIDFTKANPNEVIATGSNVSRLSDGDSLQNVEAGGKIQVRSDTSKGGETLNQPWFTDKAAENLPAPDRYLIKNADYKIEAVDPKQASVQLIASVIAAGGYVANQQESIDTLGRFNISLQVRVPADTLDGTMQGIEALGRVLNKQVSTEDVTEEYIDTDARIRNLKKTEERLLDHLSKSLLMESTLKVEQELTRVREQLERLEGRLKYLSHRVAFSTIHIMFQEKPKAESILPPLSFSSGQVASEAARTLFAFAQALWSKIIWLGIWSPVWGTVLFLFWLVWRFIRMRRS